MHRRTLLAATATTATAAVAGCAGAGEEVDPPVSSGDAGGDDKSGDGTAAGVETAVEPELRSTDIAEVDPESIDETAVSFAPDAVRVAGTVVGETGCHGVEVADAGIDGGEFRVVVAAVDESDPETMCTQALTTVGYELDATFNDGVPESVRVTHDGAHGRETAASGRPNAE